MGVVAGDAAEDLLAQGVGLLPPTNVAGEAALVANATPSGQVAGGAELGDSCCQQLRRLGDVLLARRRMHGAQVGLNHHQALG